MHGGVTIGVEYDLSHSVAIAQVDESQAAICPT